MWLVYWRCKSPEGAGLARWDWRLRYLLIVLFAAGMVCGIFVRNYIREAYRSALPAIAAGRATAADNAEFALRMRKGTWALVVLWILLFAIGALGAFKPAFD